MTAVAPKPITSRPYPARRAAKGSMFVKMMHTTDPKDIAILYLVTTFVFFMVGGAMALLIRGELAVPGQQFLSNEQYNQMFTMHGTIMLLLYATPSLFGFANYIVPLQIGAPDVAFPRLNAFSYWLFLFGALIVMSSFLTPGGAADFGWFAYTPAVGRRALARRRCRPLDLRPRGRRSRHDPRWRQLHHHDPVHAGARHDDVPDADLHLEHLRHVVPDPACVPDPDRCPVRAAGRPAPRGARVRPRQRRCDPLAAPVLVLRPPRGLHPGAAVLRHRHRGDPGVRSQAAVRLQGHGVRDARDRRPVRGGVGAPHVRHRRRAAAVLLAHDVPDRGADRASSS